MRKEAQKIYRELETGKSVSQINANPKTKSKINRIFLYRKLIDILISDITTGNYTFSTYDLQKLINKKEEGRQNI